MSNFRTRPTYVIGLGGTGVNVLRRMKQKYREKFNEIPKTVSLLGIDTDDQNDAVQKGDRLARDEFFHLQVNGADVVQNLHHYPHIEKWWKYDESLNVSFIANGANARRPIGRLALYSKLSEVLNKLTTTFDGPFKYANVAGYPEELKKTQTVYIIASLAGGTGTGMFLDLACLARHRFGNSGLIFGILGMPSIFARLGSAIQEAHQRNGYAALRELDFFQTNLTHEDFFRFPQLPFGQAVIGTPDQRKRRLFDLVHLLGRVGSDGIVFDDPAEIFDRMAEYIFASIALPVGTQGMSVLDNALPNLRPGTRQFRPRQEGIYASFGVETVGTPTSLTDEVLARLAPGLAQALIGKPVTSEVAAAIVERAEARREGLPRLESLLRSDRERGALIDIDANLEVFDVPPKDIDDALRIFAKTQQNLREATSRFRPDDELRNVSGNLKDWVDDVIKDSLRSGNGLLGAQRSLKALEERIARFNCPPRPEGQDIPALIRATKRFYGVDKKALANAWQTAREELQFRFDGEVLQKIVAFIVPIIRETNTDIARNVERLQLAERRVRAATDRIAEDARMRAARPASSSQQPLIPIERARALLEKHDGETVQTALDAVVGSPDSFDRVKACIEGLAEESGWRDLLEAELAKAVDQAKKKHLDRRDHREQLISRIERSARACQPLAHFDFGEHERREAEVGEIKPLQFISTFSKGVELDLEKALREKGIIDGDASPLIDNGDPERDDIFVTRLGLFLDTLTEVRAARASFFGPREKPHSREFLRSHSLFPDSPVDAHDFFGMSDDDGRTWFLGALLLGAIRQVGPGLTFNSAVFGREIAVDLGGHGEWKPIFDAAYRAFVGIPSADKIVQAAFKDMHASRGDRFASEFEGLAATFDQVPSEEIKRVLQGYRAQLPSLKRRIGLA